MNSLTHNIIIKLLNKFYEAVIFEFKAAKNNGVPLKFVRLFTYRQAIRLCHEARIEFAMIILYQKGSKSKSETSNPEARCRQLALPDCFTLGTVFCHLCSALTRYSQVQRTLTAR